jgi:hypothetical protein
MTAMERVWTRMKIKASKFAKRETLVGLPEAQRTVLTICRRELASFPPPDALEYLTAELVRLSLEERNAVTR